MVRGDPPADCGFTCDETRRGAVSNYRSRDRAPVHVPSNFF
jgi:hypothetical protein